jgi:hypothetical protein
MDYVGTVKELRAIASAMASGNRSNEALGAVYDSLMELSYKLQDAATDGSSITRNNGDVKMKYTFDNATFSDLHKEAFGFRPDSGDQQIWDCSSDDDKQEWWDDMCNEIKTEDV